jgi:hypothetical protein
VSSSVVSSLRSVCDHSGIEYGSSVPVALRKPSVTGGGGGVLACPVVVGCCDGVRGFALGGGACDVDGAGVVVLGAAAPVERGGAADRVAAVVAVGSAVRGGAAAGGAGCRSGTRFARLMPVPPATSTPATATAAATGRTTAMVRRARGPTGWSSADISPRRLPACRRLIRASMASRSGRCWSASSCSTLRRWRSSGRTGCSSGRYR